MAAIRSVIGEHSPRERVLALALLRLPLLRRLSSGSSSQSQGKIALSSRPISRTLPIGLVAARVVKPN